jgi:hypothetical protein
VVDVSDVIVSAIRHHGEHPDTSIYFQRPDHPIQAGIVVGDFERVILNLLDNARYSVKEKTARDPGHQGKIDLTLAGDDEAVEISITDNGVGIAEQNLPMLGTPFYTTKPPGKVRVWLVNLSRYHRHNSSGIHLHRKSTGGVRPGYDPGSTKFVPVPVMNPTGFDPLLHGGSPISGALARASVDPDIHT